MLICFILLTVSAYCAYTDYFKNFKIYDKVTLPVMLGGVLYHTLLGNGFVFSVKGLILGTIVLVLAVITTSVGDGDGKLLMALGAWSGWFMIVIIFGISYIYLGIWATILSITKSEQKMIPYGVCVFGAVVTMMLLILFVRL